MLAFQPQPHGIEGQHAIDGEMRPDVAQQRDVAQSVQPIAVVRHHCIGGTVTEAQERIEALADPGHVRRDLLVRQQLPGLILAGRIADPRRSAAHQHHRLMSVLLEQAQAHDADEVADMQAVGCAVEADICRHRPGQHALIQRLQIGALENEPALRRFAQELAFRHHSAYPFRFTWIEIRRTREKRQSEIARGRRSERVNFTLQRGPFAQSAS